MMAVLYRIFTSIVALLLPVVALFVKKGKFKDFVVGRREQNIDEILPKNGRRYWFHCASLGEFEQARPLIEALKSENASNSIVITFFSPSGYNQRSNYPLADEVLYLPLDTMSNARKLIRHLQADVAIFIKYEIWYCHLKALQEKDIPVFLVSAVFRKNQFLFTALGSWLLDVLKQFKMIFLQDKNSFELLEARGLKNIKLSGDTRYDRVKQHALNVRTNDVIANFKGNSPLLILGSSWQEEEKLALEFLKDKLFDQFKLIIAPHDISENHVDEIIQNCKTSGCFKYTEAQVNSSDRVMVLNTIGHLSSAYHYADIALIGGGFGRGLHNILEALAFGVPVIFGPEVTTFPEAALAMHSEVAISIKDYETFKKAIKYFMPDSKIELVTRAKCIDYINWHSGATDAVVGSIVNG